MHSATPPIVIADPNIHLYFAYANMGVEVEADGLQQVPFGEYLVQQGSLSRAQLLDALWEQEKNNPGIPLGEIIAFLGFLPYPEVDRLLTQWNAIPIVEIA